MTQPVQYSRGYSFTDFASGSPNSQPPGTKLDQEFDGVAQTLRQTLANLAVIQRDDTQLRNGIVGVDQFSAAALALIGGTAFDVRGSWVTSTAYAAGDIVSDDGVVYLVMAAHTAGVLATDVAAGRLVVMFDAAQADRVRDTFTGDGVTTVWTLSQEPVRASDVQVFVNGLLLEGGDYAVAGDELAITPAVTNSFPIEVFTIFKDSMAPLTQAQIVAIVNAAAASAVKGDSAYQVWLNEGNTGTEADFLANIASTKAMASALGVASSAANMGSFTSPLIPDNATAKAAIEGFATTLKTGAGAPEVGFAQEFASSHAITIGGKFARMVAITDDSRVSGDYEGVPTEGTDNTTFIQACFDHCVETGQSAYVPDGRFRTTAALSIERGTSDDPTLGGMRGITILGGGPASCQIVSDHAGDALTYQGGAGAGWHTYFTIRGIGFTRSTLNQSAGSIGLNILEAAYLAVEACDFYGFEFGIYGVDVLSSDFIRNTIRGNGKGIRLLRGTRSYPNAINLFGNKILNNIIYGVHVTGGSNVNIFGGSIESNGYTGTLEDVNSWGVRVDDAGYEGAVGLNMQGVYTENNNGVADVYIVQSANAVMHNIDGCGFLRFADARRVTANILQFVGTTGTRTIVKGCGFKSLTGYTDSAARPFIGGTDFTVIDGGNVFRDVSGGTVGLLQSVFDPQGEWQGAVASDGTAVTLPPGWSSSRSSAGVYVITHNLGLSAGTHSLTVTAVGGSGSTNGRACQGYAESSNSFEVYTCDFTGAVADSAFSFKLSKI